jgi:hypothetical protein
MANKSVLEIRYRMVRPFPESDRFAVVIGR